MFIWKDGEIQLYTYNCSLKCEKYKVKIKVYLESVFVMPITNAYCVLGTILGTLEKIKDINWVLLIFAL